MPEIDFIIVGQGLAGSFLAHELIRRQCKIVVFDEGVANTSSKVAAGIFNPVTGQRMALSWNALPIFSFLDKFYKELETILDRQFYHPIGIYKPFMQIKDQNDWMGRSTDPTFIPFIKQLHVSPLHDRLLTHHLGGVELNHAGYVNTITLLNAFRQFFEKKNMYIQQKFLHDSLYLSERSITYGEIKAGKVIFCEGSSAVQNRFFNKLPFGLVKGEILKINSGLVPNQIISKDIFLLPSNDSTIKIGATYDRSRIDDVITEEAKSYLMDKLKLIFKPEFEVVDQQAGIRPATKDRRPFVGLHPDNKLIGIFNGFGTKGISLGPYYAKQFADHLLNQQIIDKEADIRRYI